MKRSCQVAAVGRICKGSRKYSIVFEGKELTYRYFSSSFLKAGRALADAPSEVPKR
jgi:hypothetical protein